jgi:hypothetical protein
VVKFLDEFVREEERRACNEAYLFLVKVDISALEN